MKRMMVIIFVGLMLVVSSCQSNNIPPETSQPVVPSESSVLSTSNEEEPLSYELLHEDGVDGWIWDDYFSVWVKNGYVDSDPAFPIRNKYVDEGYPWYRGTASSVLASEGDEAYLTLRQDYRLSCYDSHYFRGLSSGTLDGNYNGDSQAFESLMIGVMAGNYDSNEKVAVRGVVSYINYSDMPVHGLISLTDERIVGFSFLPDESAEYVELFEGDEVLLFGNVSGQSLYTRTYSDGTTEEGGTFGITVYDYIVDPGQYALPALNVIIREAGIENYTVLSTPVSAGDYFPDGILAHWGNRTYTSIGTASTRTITLGENLTTLNGEPFTVYGYYYSYESSQLELLIRYDNYPEAFPGSEDYVVLRLSPCFLGLSDNFSSVSTEDAINGRYFTGRSMLDDIYLNGGPYLVRTNEDTGYSSITNFSMTFRDS